MSQERHKCVTSTMTLHPVAISSSASSSFNSLSNSSIRSTVVQLAIYARMMLHSECKWQMLAFPFRKKVKCFWSLWSRMLCPLPSVRTFQCTIFCSSFVWELLEPIRAPFPPIVSHFNSFTQLFFTHELLWLSFWSLLSFYYCIISCSSVHTVNLIFILFCFIC